MAMGPASQATRASLSPRCRYLPPRTRKSIASSICKTVRPASTLPLASLAVRLCRTLSVVEPSPSPSSCRMAPAAVARLAFTALASTAARLRAPFHQFPGPARRRCPALHRHPLHRLAAFPALLRLAFLFQLLAASLASLFLYPARVFRPALLHPPLQLRLPAQLLRLA